MFFVAKIFWMLFEPSNLLILVLAAGIILCWMHRDSVGRPLILASAAAMLVVWLLPVGQWLAMPLEARFQRGTLPSHVDGILILGNGLDPKIYASRGVPNEQPSEQRIVAGAELARRFPRAKVVFSGGSGALFGGDSEAGVARMILMDLGVPARQILLEDKSRDTWENLVFTRRLVSPKAGETWILVTSAIHMPRAMGIAHRVGWQMIPWPAEYITASHGSIRWHYDYADKAGELQEVLHEWIGLVAYRLEGRTDSIFP
jgi:uncharacterized SAM-binding protein YcdF (DUF218 family)